MPLFSFISRTLCHSWDPWLGMLSDKNISWTPPCADGLSAWLVTTCCLLQEDLWWTASFWRRTLSMDWLVRDAEDALTAVWPVAGENHRAWNEAAVAAGSDLCESQETVGGMLLVQQRWKLKKKKKKNLLYSKSRQPLLTYHKYWQYYWYFILNLPKCYSIIIITQ